MKRLSPFQEELLSLRPHLIGFAKRLAKLGYEDLVQDTFVLALKYQDKFQLGTNMKAWLFQIMKNHFISSSRRAWRTVEIAEGQAERVPTPANAHHLVELKEALEALSYLPQDQVRCFMLAAEGLSMEEISEIEKIPIGTVKSRVSRGHDALEAFFGEQG